LSADFDTLLAACGLPRLEGRALLEHCSGRSREWLVAHGDEPVPAEVAARFDSLARRRRDAGEPLAYLLGRREFHGREFEVGPGVLIPRPETERLVELVLDQNPGGARVLELGTGSGCIAITLACLRPAWSVLATDRSAAALDVARRNATRLCPEALASGRLELRLGDWWNAVPSGERFGLIASNPPYVAQRDPHLEQGDLRFEPIDALAAGTDGLDALRTLCAGAGSRLVRGGWLLVEHGFDQGGAVRSLFSGGGFEEVVTVRDRCGLERVTRGRTPLAA